MGPVFKSSTVARFRHFATVFGLMPSSRLNCASEACDHSGHPSNRWRDGPRYCCSDGVRSRGAPVTNLSHTASFHSQKRIAPSNHGIKHLAAVGSSSAERNSDGRTHQGHILVVVTNTPTPLQVQSRTIPDFSATVAYPAGRLDGASTSSFTCDGSWSEDLDYRHLQACRAGSSRSTPAMSRRGGSGCHGHRVPPRWLGGSWCPLPGYP